ncbi:MAG: carbamoyl-phosphate synthase large subunit [Ignavibacteriaceae bacterium]|nr:MAG: carbamoyl-phosphate synthase large subunit [Chlorobiota bacterium]MBV6399162.1 Carbamoyl-phosphate synthase large chain [Ignavibacteria bacterium]MCC6885391.1 carbamoyl-phosphate synthase large subunit [Ignavibacteriales bacterium]MCE7953634.1 carbamoyl-phosphate synthase large subunit [Chlorobi bacterium CHB7]MDL1887476.1 carbamoyl-phosphate synthase large subunit [Ignavibacteria bacterium CHB1]MEB2329950.1 carbamoyl-phosphate synthase large subunit [Ignavibacteriaceae bacterium]RIK4
MKNLTPEILLKAKRLGFSDKQIAHILNTTEQRVRSFRRKHKIYPVFKTVDTCAAEFEASTPYHYSTYEKFNEIESSDKPKVIILGGGPNRIGQGIEFDYCCVRCVKALREEGFETIMVNCNPETVSTDYDTTDKLYFEPLTAEDVLNILKYEKNVKGVIVSFGGQTPLKISKELEKNGLKILGTSSANIDVAEDRKKFGKLLDNLGIPKPEYGTVKSLKSALKIARRIGYPVLVRPSYVLGGRAMQIVYNDETLKEFFIEASQYSEKHPVLIDKFLEEAREIDVDAVCDGKDVYIGGIMQHIEEAGIHSGDSTSILPPVSLTSGNLRRIKSYTKKIALGLKVIGLINIQFAIKDNVVYVIEANPRASRTVPFVSKTTGIPLATIAAKVIAGKKLKIFKLKEFDKLTYIGIKESVFPFQKFPRAKMFLGPEMRSTGEVMGVAKTFGAAMAKAQESTGNPLPVTGNVFISLNNNDKKQKALEIISKFEKLGFGIVATRGTSKWLLENNIFNEPVYKVNEGRPNVVDLIKNKEINFVINTPLGEESRFDEYAIGWAAVQYKIPFITTLSAASSAVEGIARIKSGDLSVRSLQEYYKMY